MIDNLAQEDCPRCRRTSSPHYGGVCLECGGMMFFWWPIDAMEEPREEVIKRRIERIDNNDFATD